MVDTPNIKSKFIEYFDKGSACDTSIISSKTDVNIIADKSKDKTIKLLLQENEEVFKNIGNTAAVITTNLLDENCENKLEIVEKVSSSGNELVIKGIASYGIKKQCVKIKSYST